MADPTLSDALSFLMPFVGTGGATAIIVAWLGTRRKPQGEPDKAPQIGIQALLADHLAMERFTNELKRLADAAEEIARHGDRLLDVMDIARVVEKLRRGD
mgnify:FL=1